MSEQPSHFKTGFFITQALLDKAAGLPDDHKMEITVKVRFHPRISMSLTELPDGDGFVTISTDPGKLSIENVNRRYKSASAAVTSFLHSVNRDFRISDTRKHRRKEGGQIVKLHVDENGLVIRGHGELSIAQIKTLPERTKTTGVLKNNPAVAIIFDK